jgi:hypothetical protein
LENQAFSDSGKNGGVSPGDEYSFWPSISGLAWNAYVLPYLPFFSSCRGFDNHIPLFLLLENEINCNLVKYNATAFINQWDFINTPSPLEVESAMDSCSWTIPCMYEEEIAKV